MGGSGLYVVENLMFGSRLISLVLQNQKFVVGRTIFVAASLSSSPPARPLSRQVVGSVRIAHRVRLLVVVCENR